MTGNNYSRDPLDLARQELDFAALASSAPAVKDIMYKAQTMAPLPSSQRLDKAAGAGIAALALAALVFLPWVPQKSVINVLSVQFEQTMRPDEAQSAVGRIVQALPDDMLLGAQYTALAPGSDSGDETRGMLSLSVSGFNESARELERGIGRVISAELTDTAPPLISAAPPYRASKQVSPYRMVASKFTPQDEAEAVRPGAELAARVVASEGALGDGLEQALSGSYFMVEDLHFLTPDADVPAKLDHFAVPTWPYPLSISVGGYRNFTASEQADVQARAREFLRTVNLVDRGLALWDNEARPAVVVQVYGIDGELDMYATERLQAWTRQPRDGGSGLADLDVQASVADGIAEVLGEYVCRVEYERLRSNDNKVQYDVRVAITGLREDSGPADREALLKSSADGPSAGIDW